MSAFDLVIFESFEWYFGYITVSFLQKSLTLGSGRRAHEACANHKSLQAFGSNGSFGCFIVDNFVVNHIVEDFPRLGNLLTHGYGQFALVFAVDAFQFWFLMPVCLLLPTLPFLAKTLVALHGPPSLFNHPVDSFAATNKPGAAGCWTARDSALSLWTFIIL